MINTHKITYYAPDGTCYKYSKVCSAVAKHERLDPKKRKVIDKVIVTDTITHSVLQEIFCSCIGEANAFVNNWRQHAPLSVKATAINFKP